MSEDKYATAIQKLSQLHESFNEWIDAIEKNMLDAMENYDHETRESLLDSALEQLGYVGQTIAEMCEIINDICEHMRGVVGI